MTKKLTPFLKPNEVLLDTTYCSELTFSNLKSILNNAYNEGLCYTTIIDVNKTTLYFVNTWVDEKASDKFHKTNIDIVKQIRDMGVNLAIDGGKSETIYENDLLLDFFDKT